MNRFKNFINKLEDYNNWTKYEETKIQYKDSRYIISLEETPRNIAVSKDERVICYNAIFKIGKKTIDIIPYYYMDKLKSNCILPDVKEIELISGKRMKGYIYQKDILNGAFMDLLCKKNWITNRYNPSKKPFPFIIFQNEEEIMDFEQCVQLLDEEVINNIEVDTALYETIPFEDFEKDNLDGLAMFEKIYDNYLNNFRNNSQNKTSVII